jgi:hypothetical protein
MGMTSKTIATGTIHRTALAAADGTAIETAILVPSKFHITPGVDLVLFYHGMTRHYGSKTLDQYIAEKDFSAVFDAVGTDGRFALVFPWLGASPNGAGIQEHITASANHFDTYLGAAIDIVLTVGTRGPGFIGPVEALRRFVIAGHSAGGVSLGKTAALKSKFVEKSIAAWCLDCFYGINIGTWTAWQKAKPGRTLFCCYTEGGEPKDSTKDESLRLKSALAGQKGAEIAPSAVGHHHIPKHYFPKLLARIP